MGHGRYIDPICGSHYKVAAGETLQLTYVILPGESRDIDVAVDLTGEGANLEIKALYLSRADEKV
ncbi:MAG: hypothetical protein II791_07065, partial [Bacteroidales bacterium]|nr:hypothetical protein [Bacteroidales bacterium]